MTAYYAGIGSRSTPPEILSIMTRLATKLEQDNYILRSGGASGADSAFQAGVKNPTNMEIYLPSSSFNGLSAGSPGIINYQSLHHAVTAEITVNTYHPAPDRLSSFARHLMARNAMQVMGYDMNTPAKMIVAYTTDGAITGGTGQALRMAQEMGIPIRNLGVPDTLQSTLEYISS